MNNSSENLVSIDLNIKNVWQAKKKKKKRTTNQMISKEWVQIASNSLSLPYNPNPS